VENYLAFLDVFNPENLIQVGGLTLLILIIFAETGLFFGFFLPGDSLLFVAGLLSQSKYLDVPIWLMIIILIIAAGLGSTAGYLTGRWAEKYLTNMRENIFYKKKYLEMTRDFYDKYGMMAFVLGRFVPIIRTFVPILSGIVRIDFPKFVFYNFLGAALWIITMVMAGHLLGNAFPQITEHLELIVVGMILLSTLPVIITWLRHQKRENEMNKN
jgi:membrane-associated protein